MTDIFLIMSPQTGNLESTQFSKTVSTNQFDFVCFLLFLFAKRLIYFSNKLPKQIKKNLKIILKVSENIVKKKIQKVFWIKY